MGERPVPTTLEEPATCPWAPEHDAVRVTRTYTRYTRIYYVCYVCEKMSAGRNRYLSTSRNETGRG